MIRIISKKAVAALLCAALFTAPAYTFPVAGAGEGAVSPKAAAVSVAVTPGKSGTNTVDPGDSAGLTGAITKAKALIGGTDAYLTFDHSISSYNKVTLYYLNWRDGKNGEPEINMTVGSDGVIYGYTKNIESGSAAFVIPKITKAQALTAAYDFTKKANPDYIGLISKQFAVITYNKSGSYSVRFRRVNNGIAVDGNEINVTVTSDGEVSRYSSMAIARAASAPAQLGTPLSKDAVLASFKKSLPMEPVYQSYYPKDSEKAEIRLVYRLDSDYTTRLFDAYTGKMYSVVYEESDGPYYGRGGYNLDSAASAEAAAQAGSELTEAEIAAVELQASFITADAVTKKIKAIPEFGGYDLVISSSVLNRVKSIYGDGEKYFWYINYDFKSGKNIGSASVIVNAGTGEITGFSAYSGDYKYKKASEYKYGGDECAAAAEAFLKKYYAEKSAEYKKSDKNAVIPLDSEISSYNYTYYRYVNGILFDSDMILITVDPDTLTITSFRIVYSDDASFPSTDGMISADAAVDKYFGLISLSPYYVVTAGTDKDGNLIKSVNYLNPDSKQLALVYSYTDYCYVDAFKGNVVGCNGEAYVYSPVKYYSESVFGDISQSKYKDIIRKLADMDVVEQSDRFSPARPVTQKEYIKMLSYLNDTIYYSRYSSSFTVGASEIDESANITREAALKTLIDAMGYGDIAVIKGIYTCPLSDADKISPNLYGYVTLAYGLGLTDIFGSTLAPQSQLTREEAAALVYSYMTYANQKLPQ